MATMFSKEEKDTLNALEKIVFKAQREFDKAEKALMKASAKKQNTRLAFIKAYKERRLPMRVPLNREMDMGRPALNTFMNRASRYLTRPELINMNKTNSNFKIRSDIALNNRKKDLSRQGRLYKGYEVELSFHGGTPPVIGVVIRVKKDVITLYVNESRPAFTEEFKYEHIKAIKKTERNFE